jgi:hypothetical protein
VTLKLQFSQIDVKVHNTTAAGLVLRMQPASSGRIGHRYSP